MEGARSFLAHSLSADSRRELLDGAERRRLAAGELLFRAGDRARELYILEQGEIAIELEVAREGSVRLCTVEPGEVFGWSAVLEPRVETATARAVTASEVIAIEAGPLLESIESNQRLGVDLYRALASVIASRLTAMRTQLAGTLTPA